MPVRSFNHLFLPLSQFLSIQLSCNLLNTSYYRTLKLTNNVSKQTDISIVYGKLYHQGSLFKSMTPPKWPEQPLQQTKTKIIHTVTHHKPDAPKHKPIAKKSCTDTQHNKI